MQWAKRLNYVLIAAALLIISVGLVFIYSSTILTVHKEWSRQFTYFILGLSLLVITAAVDYEFWGRKINLFYCLNLFLLLAVLFFGHESRGAQRWLGFGPVVFQPSELAKLIMIIYLAKLASTREGLDAFQITKMIILTAVPLGLILVQPDLGTTLTVVFIIIVIAFFAEVKWYYLFGAVIGCLAAAPFILKPYQKERLLSFLNPQTDPMGSSWNLIQSKIAIGSGKIFGKGLFSGTQSHLRFVPENSTDFIFSILGEELGLIGCVFLLILYLVFLLEGLKIAKLAKDDFGKFLAIGITTMFFFPVLINIGMTIGIMPITGIPLPLVSYGGTSLITNMAAVGILLSIYLRREKIFI